MCGGQRFILVLIVNGFRVMERERFVTNRQVGRHNVELYGKTSMSRDIINTVMHRRCLLVPYINAISFDTAPSLNP